MVPDATCAAVSTVSLVRATHSVPTMFAASSVLGSLPCSSALVYLNESVAAARSGLTSQ